MSVGPLRREGFLTSLTWLGASEGVLRVLRILTTLVLARLLVPEAYGVAAIAVTVHELVFVLARNGLSIRLIQCDEARLHRVVYVAYRLNLVAGVGLFCLQAASARPIALHFDDARLGPMVASLAIVHLIAPLSFVPYSLLQRTQRLKELAVANLATVACDNLLTVLLAFGGAGPWALILPKLLVAPLWTYLLLRAFPYRPPPLDRGALPWRETALFGIPVLGTEVAKAARGHLDYLLVGHFLGLEALGLYFFAYNAGLGVSSALIRAFSTAVLPHLCSGDGSTVRRLHRSYRTILRIAVPLVVLQSAAAPLYVPLLFGDRWREAVPVLVLICLSAVPRILEEGSSQLLRAQGLPRLDFWWNFAFSAFVLLSVWVGLSGGTTGVGWAVLLSHLVALPWVSVWVAKVCDRPSTASAPKECLHGVA